MGWIENAVPDSRYAKQVAMIKDMGANSIRCSHYPRGDAFYHACDSVGMLVLRVMSF
jgi:beta-galactosidase